MDNDGWDSEGESAAAAIREQQEIRDSKTSRYQDDGRQGNYRNRRGGNRQNTFTNSNWRNRSDQRESGSSVRPTIMDVKSSLVGKIIGRGGSNIRDIEAQSEAKVKIDKNDSSEQQTTVSLFGTAEAQAKAKEMILALFDDNRSQRQSNNDFYNNPYSQDRGNVSNAYSQDEDNQEYDWPEIARRSRKLLEEFWAKLPPITKNFYIEDPEVAGMLVRDVEAWRLANNNISVERVPTDTTLEMPCIPNPVKSFEQAFSPYPEILDEIYKQNFKCPSPIQCQAWPILLCGQDMIGIAQTGTGKTLAFILPALIHIENQPIAMEDRLGPNVLILAPTRELAIQIEREVSKYQYRGIKSVCLYGGGSRDDQINVLSKGVQIVIATPGRLNDLVMAKHIKVETVTYLVLDEADRMLDMGFGPQIRLSLSNVRPDKQTIMTSATWPAGVQRLAASYMKNPVQVVVGTLDLAAVHSVKQELLFVEDDVEEKFRILVEWLRSMEVTDKVIVFCGRRATAIAISADLALMGFTYQSIYGGLDQCDREQALEDMRTGEANILIATDIASRGIDIENITHIINFDFPHNLEEFVHRVGRTGRAGRSGIAITYISRRDWANAEGLISILKEAGEEVPDELVDMAERFNRKKAEKPTGRFGRGRGRRYW